MMALWIGAVMEARPHITNDTRPAVHFLVSAFLQVNLMGERFQNEMAIPSNVNARRAQPGKVAWRYLTPKYPEELPYLGIGPGKIIIAI